MLKKIELFISYLEHEKRYSINTIEAYERDLSFFYQYLAEAYDVINIKDVTHVMIRSWILDNLEKGISVTSVKRKLSTLKSYFKYAIRNNLVEINPMTKIVAPKSPKRIPSFVKESEMNKLLSEVEFGAGFSGMRDKLILEIFYQTGVRVSELVGIREKDIDFSLFQLKVLGKRNKERIIPISAELQNQIRVYLREKQKGLRLFSENLIVTDKGEKATRKFVYDKVNHYLSQVSSLKKRSPHVLRHTFATHMLQNGADLNAIKEILGHSSLAATQVYAHNSLERLKEAHKKAHPRD